MTGEQLPLIVNATESQMMKCSGKFSVNRRVAPFLSDDHRPKTIIGFNPISGWMPPPSVPSDLVPHILNAIEAVCASLHGSRPDQIATELAVMAAVSGRPKQGEKQARVRVEAYQADLADIPPDVLATACRTHRRENNFFPSIAELIKLSEPAISRRKTFLRRLEILWAVSELPAPYGEVSFDWYLKLQKTADQRFRPQKNADVFF